MSYKWLIRKGDQVVVLSGKDKGVQGEVLEVLRQKERVRVKGVCMLTRHQKPSQDYAKGGRIRREGSIHVSNVSHVDPKTGKASRVGVRNLKDGKRVLFAKRSGEEIRQL